MVLAYLDCPTGVAGDMLLAALFDLGLPRSVVEVPLAQLGLAGAYRLTVTEARSGGQRGARVSVEGLEPHPPHRHWLELREQISAAPLEPALKQRVLAVFTRLAEAEGRVHGHAPEQVHFHEVGAVDALVDMVGVCAGLLHFQVEPLICAPPPAGHGTVRSAHGLLPLPAPAVLELARARQVPLAGTAELPAGELTTPTGMALLSEWATAFGAQPSMVPSAVGIGLGHRVLDRPNLLRLWLGEASAPPMAGHTLLETVLLQQAQIDDASAEDLAFLADELRRAGALEVFSQPALMKKGRSGVLLSVVAHPQAAPALRAIWWRHGTSLGVREQLQQRWCLPRHQAQLATPWGPVRVKVSLLPDGQRQLKAEHDDLIALARREQLSLRQVRAAVQQALADPAALAEHNAAAMPDQD